MAAEPNILLRAALAYAGMGYAVFPCVPGGKVPMTRRGFLDATTDVDQITQWWTAQPAANIGMPTQGLVVVDADCSDGEPNPWLADEPQKQASLNDAPLSITPRGGRHYFFRQPPGRSWRNTESRITPKVDTRANGGYVVVPPSVREDGRYYRWADTFELNAPPKELPEPPPWLVKLLDQISTRRPLSQRAHADGNGAVRIPEGRRNSTLARLAGGMRRMGMTADEIHAGLNRVNQARCTPPLPPPEVRRVADSIARYEPDAVTVALVEEHYDRIFEAEPAAEPAAPVAEDPGPLPDELLRVPGFVGEVMDHCLATAPYPNPVMAFCGALALQAFLAGRRVRDPTDNRTNIYLLGLAHSAAGKDHPRKINARITHEIGLGECIGDRFASGEGVQDALFVNPCMLFQTDEIDGMLQSINRAKDARHENIMSTLLTMYSASNSVFPMRRRADKSSMGAIDQPNLVIFGTAIPTHYYEALSERMLTNGFFARMVILESGPRCKGQEPRITSLPPRVVRTARWWGNYRPGRGNLQDWHPVPAVVKQTNQALTCIVESREEAETEYSRCEIDNDAVGTTVWGRVSEHIRKFSLLYAVSENYRTPVIGLAATRWASRFVLHHTRRMLFMASSHVAANEFDAECKQVIRALLAWRERHGDDLMPVWRLKRALKMRPAMFRDAIVELEQRQEIHHVRIGTQGRPREGYVIA